MKTSRMLYTIFFDNNNYHFTYNTIVFRMELNPPAKETETRKVIANSNCKKHSLDSLTRAASIVFKVQA